MTPPRFLFLLTLTAAAFVLAAVSFLICGYTHPPTRRRDARLR